MNPTPAPNLRLRRAAGQNLPHLTMLFALVLLAMVKMPALAGPTDPEDKLFDFYHAIQTHQCDEAAILAKGYSVEQCRQTLYLKWMVDFQGIKTKCQNLELAKPPAAFVEAEPPAGPVSPALNAAADKLPASQTPTEKSPPPSSSGLLRLWPNEELRGYPGEERITQLRHPNLDPPEFTNPSESLPKFGPQMIGSIRRVRLPPGKNLIALTFDLCEQADDITGYDRGIVNYLRDNLVPATFFAGGKWMRSHPERAMQLMADPNFEIGNHGWTHGNLRVLTGQKMREQIIWTQAEYEKLRGDLAQRAQQAGLEAEMRQIPQQPATLRFPYGTCSADSLAAVNGLGLGAVQWDVVSGDAAPRMSAVVLAKNVIASARPGSIIIFHANGRGHGTAAALPEIVAALRAKGYAFSTVSQLLQEGVPETAKECYELKPGDNAYIDRKFGEGTQ